MHGELLTLGVKVAASTAWQILRQAGVDPAPNRAATTRAQFLRSQSTPQQVIDHCESTRLQYGLTARAVELGWAPSRVLVIDEDLGHSASGLDARPGFARLVSEVGLDHVGLVLGVEMSRLARSGREWHQLLELCALSSTLLADPQGVYDPTDHNDRLVRHEVLCDRVEVKDHHPRAVAAAREKLGAVRSGRRR